MDSRKEMMEYFEKNLAAALKAVDPSGHGHDEIEAKLYNLVNVMVNDVEEVTYQEGFNAGYEQGYDEAQDRRGYN